MRKILVPLLMICVGLGANSAIGQETISGSLPDNSKTGVSEERLFNEVYVHLQAGGVLQGLLTGVQSDGLILGIGDKKKAIPFNDLSKIIIRIDKRTNRHALFGMLTGIYLGNLIFYRAKEGPAAFVRHSDLSTLGYLIWNSIFAGGGIGLGFLAGSAFGRGESAFDFSGSQDQRIKEWERFRRYALGTSSDSTRVHLSFQGAYVNCRVSNRYRGMLHSAGYLDYYEYRGTTNFNLFRRVQLTYSIKRDVEIGLAAVLLSEPKTQGDQWLEIQDYSGYRYLSIQQSLSSLGFYALGVYRPLQSVLPKSVHWNLGAGLGAAKVNFNLGTRQETYFYPDSLVIAKNHHISKTKVSGLAFTEFGLLIDRNLSFGLAADYVFVPSDQAPAFEDMGLQTQRLRFGNGSIGFVFGLHF